MPRWPILLLAIARAAHADSETEEHHSPLEMRVSLEAPLYSHASAGSTSITDELELEPDVMISYVIEAHRLSLDLEVGESVLVSGDGAPARTGTVVRPGVAYSPVHDLFVTALLPVHLEPSPALLGLRLGAGFDFRVPFGKWFVEADVDFPLVGATGAPDAFAEQAFVIATGALFHLPG